LLNRQLGAAKGPKRKTCSCANHEIVFHIMPNQGRLIFECKKGRDMRREEVVSRAIRYSLATKVMGNGLRIEIGKTVEIIHKPQNTVSPS